MTLKDNKNHNYASTSRVLGPMATKAWVAEREEARDGAQKK